MHPLATDEGPVRRGKQGACFPRASDSQRTPDLTATSDDALSFFYVKAKRLWGVLQWMVMARVGCWGGGE